MAVQRNNVLMHGTSGSFSRQITFKQYNGKTVVAHYPDMSKVIYTKAQLAERIRFKLAVAYARSVIANPVKRKAYSGKKHFSAYHAAIAEYMRSSKAEEKEKSVTPPVKEGAVKPVTTTNFHIDAVLVTCTSEPIPASSSARTPS